MSRALFFGLLGTLVLGCGGSGSEGSKLTSLDASFSIIENAVEDLYSTIHDANYKSSGDLGSDSDRIGFALANFIKATEGKPLAADAQELSKKMSELEQLVASGASIEKQREAVSTLKASVAAAKTKL